MRDVEGMGKELGELVSFFNTSCGVQVNFNVAAEFPKQLTAWATRWSQALCVCDDNNFGKVAFTFAQSFE